MLTPATIRSAALLCALVAAGPALAAPDLHVLFGADAADAAKRMGWRGGKLDDGTALAAAVLGLTWQPVHDGVALLTGAKKKLTLAGADQRAAAFRDARSAGVERAAAAFGLSLLLDPPAQDRAACADALEYLGRFGEGLDEVLAGVLSAPDDLPILGGLKPSAADAVVQRAKPRSAAVLLALADADDPYLRSSGVAALGMLLNRDAALETPASLRFAPRPYEVSAVIRARLIDRVLKAAGDRDFRVQAAAALALGLAADRDLIQPVDRLLHDRRYIVAASDEPGRRRIMFPVAAAAAEAMARFGRTVPVPGGDLTAAEAKRVIRGCRDITRDAAKLRVNPAVSFHTGAW